MNAPERLALKIALPSAAGRIEAYDLRAPRAFPSRSPRAFTRIAYAAAHVVADPLADDRSLARGDGRLGRDDRLPALPVVAGARRRGGDGHRAARDGP